MTKREWLTLGYRLYNFPARIYLKWRVREKDFTIFSNDCFGGEVYYWLGLPYNTPLIGLMLMAPCYIRFLQRPQYYLNQPLRFIDSSFYGSMNDFRSVHHNYPLALLDDIEIHFLHYHSADEVLQKWKRRCQRINWNNLKVKFAMDKDFASEELLQQFEQLPYYHKVCFSKNEYGWSASNIQVPGFQLDAASTFRSSMKVFDICRWLNTGNSSFRNFWCRLAGSWLHTTLKK